MLNKFYIGLSSLLIGYYGLAAYNGWELGAETHKVPEGTTRQHGWARATGTHSYWHSGYRGGK